MQEQQHLPCNFFPFWGFSFCHVRVGYVVWQVDGFWDFYDETEFGDDLLSISVIDYGFGISELGRWFWGSVASGDWSNVQVLISVLVVFFCWEFVLGYSFLWFWLWWSIKRNFVGFVVNQWCGYFGFSVGGDSVCIDFSFGRPIWKYNFRLGLIWGVICCCFA
jgi:hypothetical protein